MLHAINRLRISQVSAIHPQCSSAPLLKAHENFSFSKRGRQ
jgi:hypothetical protein